MITPLPGATALKPGAAARPFFGVQPALVDADGAVITAPEASGASHANSQKDPQRQIAVCRDIAGQLAAGEDKIMGVMIESNLVGGRQDLGDPQQLTYGQSITDPCIGWEETVGCLDELARAVRARNKA